MRNYSFRLLKRDQYAFTAPKCLSSCVLYSASKCIFIRHCQWMLPFIYNSVICPISKKFVLAFKTKNFYSQKKIKKTFRFFFCFFLALMTLKVLNSGNIFLLWSNTIPMWLQILMKFLEEFFDPTSPTQTFTHLGLLGAPSNLFQQGKLNNVWPQRRPILGNGGAVLGSPDCDQC